MIGLPGLRYQRKLAGVKQSELSKAAQISTQTVSGLENNKIGTRVATISKLATALNCTPADLLTEPPSPSAPVSADELAQMEAQLVELEAKIARLKAEVDHG